MKKAYLLFCIIAVLAIACSKSDNETAHPNLVGSWKYSGQGKLWINGIRTINTGNIVITFDIIPNPKNNKVDSLYVANAIVTYGNLSSFSKPVDTTQIIKHANGTYRIPFQSEINAYDNGGNFSGCKPDKNFNSITILPNDPTSYFSNDNSWVSVTNYDGTINFRVIIFVSPLIILRTK
jgi:hypothetical protein